MIKIIRPKDSEWIIENIAQRYEKEFEVLLRNKAGKLESPVNYYMPHRTFFYLLGQKKTEESVDILYVTHVDSGWKFLELFFSSFYCDGMIFLSNETRSRVLKFMPWVRNVSCVILPASDRIAKEKKVSIALFFKIYPDGRKNENWVLETIRQLSPDMFEINIMGGGWGALVEEFLQMGFIVNYQKDFVEEVYLKYLYKADILIYTGFDEGAVSFLDASINQLCIFATDQGYHKEFSGQFVGISSQKDLATKLLRVQKRMLTVRDNIRLLSWENKANEHLEAFSEISRNKKERGRPSNFVYFAMKKFVSLSARVISR